MKGKLYIVPTPIGNLQDITFRAVSVLKQVNTILAEDTRTSRKLLKHYAVTTPMQSYHIYNEHKLVVGLVMRLQQGDTMALISDAGTPALSDPGFLLCRACIAGDIEVECLPGATAFVPALVQSGLPCDTFFFEGFLPIKKGRKKRLEFLTQQQQAFILYESPHKLLKTLQDLITWLGEERFISISRELTKIHQQTIRGSLKDILIHFQQYSIKGEFVLVVAGKIYPGERNY